MIDSFIENFLFFPINLDVAYLFGTTLLEAIRIYMGRKSEEFCIKFISLQICVICDISLLIIFFHCLAGSLSRHGWQVIVSALLIIPCMMGICYLIFFQTTRIHLEIILCALELLLQSTELIYAIVFTFTACRPRTFG